MNKLNLITVLSLSSVLAACGGDDDTKSPSTPEAQASYRLTLNNATAKQAFAPIAVILHSESYQAWDIGAPASAGLEMLAESGSPAALIAEASDVLDAQTSDGLLMPGATQSLTIEGPMDIPLQLTIAGMPVYTNDGFSGVTGWSIDTLMPGDSINTLLPMYDAGTEANTESMATLPGPDFGGEGFNAARDDLADVVTRHAGVVTMDDGLTSSALNESYRFQQGALFVTLERLQ